MVDTHPAVAAQVLTPQVTATVKQTKLHTWSLAGSELLSVQHKLIGRTKPDEVLEVLQKLAALVSVLPLPQH
jgi:hypothetical protein